jgi:hypothetical protein
MQAKHVAHALARNVGAIAIAATLLGGCSGGGESSPPQTANPASAKILPISPVAQQTPVWCWAATAEMVFRHFNLPALNTDYQCGIVAAYGGPQSLCFSNCYNCISPIGGMAQMHTLINGYGIAANQYGFPSRVLSGRLLFNALTMQQVVTEIDAGRPIIAGISPGGFAYPNFSQHVVLVVGYDINGALPPRVIVNDPFPYSLPPFSGQVNPYLFVGGTSTRPGQYSVTYAAFLSPMNWANTIDSLR